MRTSRIAERVRGSLAERAAGSKIETGVASAPDAEQLQAAFLSQRLVRRKLEEGGGTGGQEAGEVASKMGVDVLLSGPLPTPGIAFLTQSMRADAGVDVGERVTLNVRCLPDLIVGSNMKQRMGIRRASARQPCFVAIASSSACRVTPWSGSRGC